MAIWSKPWYVYDGGAKYINIILNNYLAIALVIDELELVAGYTIKLALSRLLC